MGLRSRSWIIHSRTLKRFLMEPLRCCPTGAFGIIVMLEDKAMFHLQCSHRWKEVLAWNLTMHCPVLRSSTSTCLPIVEPFFPAWCRSEIFFLVALWSWLSMESGCMRLWTGVFYTGAINTGNKWRIEELLKEDVTDLWLFVGDPILIFHHNLQINSLKILKCDLLELFLIIKVYLWWKLLASHLSKQENFSNQWVTKYLFLPHCILSLIQDIVMWKTRFWRQLFASNWKRFRRKLCSGSLQSGFKSRRSSVFALLSILHEILLGTDSGDHVVLVLRDSAPLSR